MNNETLYDKKKYVLHYTNLRLYLSLGLKLEKIQRVIEFTQTDWLRPYVEFNTEKRANKNNKFLKGYYKLLNNSVFGRFMMNTRNFRDIKIISNEEKIEKWISKPNFDRATIFTENLVAVHMKKTEVKLNQPIYLGMSILDMSKVRMYDFYYNTDFYADVKNNEQLLNELDSRIIQRTISMNCLE